MNENYPWSYNTLPIAGRFFRQLDVLLTSRDDIADKNNNKKFTIQLCKGHALVMHMAEIHISDNKCDIINILSIKLWRFQLIIF